MHRIRGCIWSLLSGFILSAALGCATYSDRTQAARTAVAAGNYDEGIAQLNKFLGVKSAEEVPKEFEDEAALAVKELMRRRPDFTPAFISTNFPGTDPDSIEILIDGLRKAGVPEG